MSDLHVEFEAFDPPKVDADAVILAGDIHVGMQGLEWARGAFPNTPVIYVPGNHEYYGQAMPAHTERLRRAARGSGVHLLANESLVLRGNTFLGCTLWTDFRLFGDPSIAQHEAANGMSDYHLIRVHPKYRKLRTGDTARLHAQSVNWLKEAMAEDREKGLIVITHHAPSRLSLPEPNQEDILNAAYASSLDHVVEDSNAKLWIHGHIHYPARYSIGQTRVLCNPRGYPFEEHGFEPDLVIEV